MYSHAGAFLCLQNCLVLCIRAWFFLSKIFQLPAGNLSSALPYTSCIVPRKQSKISNGEPTLSAAAAKLRLLKSLKCTTRYEKPLWAAGAEFIAGVDEVGRGCIFGPVVAAACILDPNYRIRGLRDSKLLPVAKREELAKRIRKHAIAYSVAAVDVAVIDRINIYQAARLAMTEAVASLTIRPNHLLIDAVRLDLEYPQTSIIHGDALSASIAAASILAKVERDAILQEMAVAYPHYDLASNKGYGTPRHLAGLREHGPTPQHRQSFAPVWSLAATQQDLEFLEDAPEELLEVAAEASATT